MSWNKDVIVERLGRSQLWEKYHSIMGGVGLWVKMEFSLTMRLAKTGGILESTKRSQLITL